MEFKGFNGKEYSICSDASHKSNPSSITQSYVDSYHGSHGRQ